MKRFLTIFLILLNFSIGCTNTTITQNYKFEYDPAKHTRDDIKRQFPVHKGRWWNYYERGLAFMEGKFWEDAIEDFKKSIAMLSRDQRSAMTYGVNHMDCFANRELGIAYYKTGQYEEAEEKLKASLDTTESSRTQFYLRELFNEIGKYETFKAPTIEILSPEEGYISKYPIVKLEVKASDQNFIDSIWVNGDQVFIELGKRQFKFLQDIRLKEGENSITVKATNLAGRETNKTIKLNRT